MTYEWVGDRAGVVTGEAVQLDLRPARVGSRTVAYVLDLLLELAVLALVLVVLGMTVAGRLDAAAAAALTLVVTLVVLLGYPVAAQSLFRGRTLGKAAMGLRVVRTDGAPAPFRAILLRELVGLVLERPGITAGVLALVSSLASARGQRLGDRWAGTLVVRTRIAGRLAPAPPMPPPLAGWAAGVDLSRLPDPLALAVRQFLGRAGELTWEARESVGGQLAAEVAAVVAPPPPGTPPLAYLAAVVAERRRRDQLRAGGAATYGPAAGGAAAYGPAAGGAAAYGPAAGGAAAYGPAAGGAAAYGPATGGAAAYGPAADRASPAMAARPGPAVTARPDPAPAPPHSTAARPDPLVTAGVDPDAQPAPARVPSDESPWASPWSAPDAKRPLPVTSARDHPLPTRMPMTDDFFVRKARASPADEGTASPGLSGEDSPTAGRHDSEQGAGRGFAPPM